MCCCFLNLFCKSLSFEGEFIPSTFKVTTDKKEIISITLLFVFYMPRRAFSPSFPFCYLLLCLAEFLHEVLKFLFFFYFLLCLFFLYFIFGYHGDYTEHPEVRCSNLNLYYLNFNNIQNSASLTALSLCFSVLNITKCHLYQGSQKHKLIIVNAPFS